MIIFLYIVRFLMRDSFIGTCLFETDNIVRFDVWCVEYAFLNAG